MEIRRLDFDGADLLIQAEGDWRGFRSAACAKEPETAKWIRRTVTPSTVFFDIGACVGSYSLIAASIGATVHAFEPVAANYNQLQTNIWINSAEQISAWPIACTESETPLSIEIASPAPGAASHRVRTGDYPAHNEQAKVQRAIGFSLDRFIDQYRIQPPTDLKVDVDGGEVEALAGARNALRSARSVMVEVNPETAPSVAAILTAAGLEHAGKWPRTGNQSNHLFERIDR